MPPHRLFFIAAALDAIGCVGIWLPAGLGVEQAWLGQMSVSSLHREGLLFGTIPAMMAGFLLTALPRWTGRPPISQLATGLLFSLWFAGRAASLPVPPVGGAISTIFILLLAAIVAREVVAVGDRRNIKIALLVAALSVAAGLNEIRVDWVFELGFRISVGALLSLVLIFGGRIAPSLTAHCLAMRGGTSPVVRPRWAEQTAAITTALALCAWTLTPYATATGIACAAASLGQTARLVQWRGWRVLPYPSVLALHVSYGWAPVGFALLAGHIFYPESVSRSAALHAWTVGAIGIMSLAIMASMTRKQSGAASFSSGLMSLSYACGLLAAVARVAAEFFSSHATTWLLLATVAWVAAFVLFLVILRRALFGGSVAIVQPPSPPTLENLQVAVTRRPPGTLKDEPVR